MPTPRQLKESSARLLAWYRRNRRDLPWRRHPSLYHVLLSEFMLQQTRVEQALPYYKRFLKRFPTLRSLARAPQDEVLKLWEGLGYYSRARNLHRTAALLAPRRKVDLEALCRCPGVGPYTLAAISSIVWGEVLPVVDGNVNRVLARILLLDVLPHSPLGKRRIRDQLTAWIDPGAPGDWNQALMELGATVCTPRQPACDECPLQRWCGARRTSRQEDYPLRAPKPPRPHRHFTAAVVDRKQAAFLLAQRPATGLLPNLWEFPSGEPRPQETLENCCLRSLREKTGIKARIDSKYEEIHHAFTHFRITLHGFRCSAPRGRLRPAGYQNLRWVRGQELETLALPRAHWPLLEQARKSLSNPAD